MSALDDYRPRIQELTQRADDAVQAAAGGGDLAESKRILTDAQRDLWGKARGAMAARAGPPTSGG